MSQPTMSRDLEESPLLSPVVEKGNTKSNTTFKVALSTVAIALIVGAISLSTGGSSSSISSLSDSSYTRAQVFSILADDKLSFHFECKSTYAYCGFATCYDIDNDNAACGCLLINDHAGKFSIDASSLILIESLAFRKATVEANDRNIDAATTVLCDAINDGSLWVQAGYDTSIGSFYYNEASDDDDSSSTQVLTIIKENTQRSIDNNVDKIKIKEESYLQNSGSCMGAPCSKDLKWGSGCEVTCICPKYATGTDTDDDDNDDETCFKNGEVKQDIPWESSLVSLASYVTNLKSSFANVDDDYLSSSCSTCSVVVT